jgi:hypothetical protein
MLADLDIEARPSELRPAAARLARLLAGLAPALRPAAWQDGLDLLAVADGLKPVCLLGRGDTDAAWLDAAAALARDLRLSMLTGACWHPATRDAGLPGWYDAALAARRAGETARYIWRDRAHGAAIRRCCAAGRIAPEDEAALLGYPVCCVAQHHAQARALEQLLATWVMRLAGDDTARGQRLVAAGVTPTPQTAGEWRQLEAAGAIAPQPWTSVNRCAACARDPDGPAGRLGRRYRALARGLAYPPLASVQ